MEKQLQELKEQYLEGMITNEELAAKVIDLAASWCRTNIPNVGF